MHGQQSIKKYRVLFNSNLLVSCYLCVVRYTNAVTSNFAPRIRNAKPETLEYGVIND